MKIFYITISSALNIKLFFFDKTIIKEDTEKIYALYCHYINLYLNEENQA